MRPRKMRRLAVFCGLKTNREIALNLFFSPQTLLRGGQVAGAHFPTFVLRLRTHLSRTSESYGHHEFYSSSAAPPFEVPERSLPLVVQELQMVGTSVYPRRPFADRHHVCCLASDGCHDISSGPRISRRRHPERGLSDRPGASLHGPAH